MTKVTTIRRMARTVRGNFESVGVWMFFTWFLPGERRWIEAGRWRLPKLDSLQAMETPR
jgi:hypothetical protein